MVKKIYLVISFFIGSTSFAMNDSAYRLGCVNKAQCKYRDIVDRYDPYCEQCEFEKYPDRFVACLFCRKPLRQFALISLSSYCFECCESIKSLLVDRLLVKNAKEPPFRNAQHAEALKMGIKAYLSWARIGVSRKYIKAFRPAHPHQEIFRPEKSAVAKPHIYLGARKTPNGGLLHIWTRELKIAPEDKKFISDIDEAEKHIAYIFDKYKICGIQTGILIEQEIDSSMVTYQEKLDT